MWAILLAIALGGVQAKATPHTGAAKTGELKALSGEGIVLATSAGDAKFTLKQLKAVDFPDAASSPEPHDGPVVELIDGSRLLAGAFTTKDGAAVVARKDANLQTPQKRVQAVLLRSQRNYPKLQAQWRRLIDSERQGDLLVVRRSRAGDGESVQHSLDQLECIIVSVNEKEVSFTLEGDPRTAPLEKLEGVIFFHSRNSEMAKPLGLVRTTRGAEIAVHKIALAGEKVDVTTRSGVQLSIPQDEIQSLRFSGGDIVYLSDLKPQSIDWRPYVPTRIGGERLQKLYAPRMDQASDGGPLRLEPGGDTYEKGISLHSRTELVYRLPDAYKRFQAQVGLDPRYRNAGNVELLIKSETKDLFRQSINPEKPRLDIQVDLSGVRRLTIIVDFGAGWDVGDFVNLCDARLTK